MKHKIFKDTENFILEIRHSNKPSSYYWYIQTAEKKNYGCCFSPDKLFIKKEIWDDLEQRACLFPLMYNRLSDVIFI